VRAACATAAAAVLTLDQCLLRQVVPGFRPPPWQDLTDWPAPRRKGRHRGLAALGGRALPRPRAGAVTVRVREVGRRGPVVPPGAGTRGPCGREPPGRISRLLRFQRGYHLLQSHH
jgi:hypothetical protein